MRSTPRLYATTWLALLSGLCACATSPTHLTVQVSPVVVDPERPGRRQLGRLTLLAAMALRSDHPRFGGFSGLEIGADGKTLIAVSDRGHWLSARLQLAADGTLQRLEQLAFQPILDDAGRPVHAPLYDAESITRDLDGSFLVGFEWNHRIWRYRPDLATGKPVELRLPPELARAPGNGSLESLAVLADGRLLFICEHYRNPDETLRGWVGREGAFSPLSYVTSDDFVPTDLALLPGSQQVLVLERAFGLLRGQRSRIRSLPVSALRPGARLEPRELARLGSPLVVDNFEGMAVQRHPTGALVYLISDDNFSPLQRTLLYQFRLRRDY